MPCRSRSARAREALRIDAELQRFRFPPGALNGSDELNTIGDIGVLQRLDRGRHRQCRLLVRGTHHPPRVLLRNQGGAVLRNLGANGYQGIE